MQYFVGDATRAKTVRFETEKRNGNEWTKRRDADDRLIWNFRRVRFTFSSVLRARVWGRALRLDDSNVKCATSVAVADRLSVYVEERWRVWTRKMYPPNSDENCTRRTQLPRSSAKKRHRVYLNTRGVSCTKIFELGEGSGISRTCT